MRSIGYYYEDDDDYDMKTMYINDGYNESWWEIIGIKIAIE